MLLVRIRENLLCPALRSVRSEIESVISVSSSGSDGRKKRRYGRAELGFAVKDGVDPFLDVARAECVETIEDISKLVTEYRSIVPGVSLRRNERAKKYYLEVSTTSCSEDPAKLAPTLFVDSAYAHSTAKTKGSSNSSNGRWTFTTRAVESLSRKNADAMERVITFSARVVDALLGRIRGTAVIPLVLAGEALAHLDLLQAFATYATLNSPTVRPEFTPDGPIAIKQGRHPVLDGDSSGSDGGSNGGGGSSSCSCSGFVPNDTFLGPSGVQVVTGPNMSGKSTYIRQVALLTIMAHMGCHVPAEFASFRVVDRIMSRVAAPVSDPDSDGTDGSFAAELRGVRSVLLATEAPNVSLSSSSSSTTFVIVDEFGRSTAPLGGRSLAWAVAERLSRSPGVLCLFVTHFCDVAAGLEAAYPALVTARHFAVERCAGNAFRPLFALTAGVSQDTLGVETAAACGLPQRYVLDIAKEFRGELKAMREAERAKRVSTTTTAAVSEGLGCEGNLTQSQVLLAKRLLSLKNSTLGLADMQKLLESIKSSI